MDVSRRVWVENTVHQMKTYWISGKEKVPGAVVRKEGHADNLLG